MRRGAGNVGNVGRGLTLAALLAGLVTGCGNGDAGPDTVSGASAKASAKTPAKVAKRGGSVGAAGSACALPVSFDIAESWTAEAVDAAESTAAAGDLAELVDTIARQGPVALVCEIDAKPAGNIGFLRVWTGKPGDADARSVLEAFVAAEPAASEAEYRTVEAGDVTGAEVEYVTTSEIMEESKTEHAFAVTTSAGPVVVHLGGMDTAEHNAMLPAYELAKSTLRATAA